MDLPISLALILTDRATPLAPAGLQNSGILQQAANWMEQGVQAAADHLYAVGLIHGWWSRSSRPPASWRDLDPIGQSEFVGIVEAMIRTYLTRSAD
jgi:hypothetical protein